MDGRRFDTLVKRVAGDAAPLPAPPRAGRRGLLTGMAGGLLATAVADLASDGARAKRKRKKRKKKTGQGICGKKCGTICGANLAILRCNADNRSCFCVRSTSGQTHCADGSGNCPPAGTDDECQTDADCPEPNSVCVDTRKGRCCRGEDVAQVNICFAKCPNTTAAASEAGGGSLVRGVLEQIPGR